MDDIIKKAYERRDGLSRRRDALRSELEAIESELRELEGFFSVAERYGAVRPRVVIRKSGEMPRTIWPERQSIEEWAALTANQIRFGEKTKAIAEQAAEIIKREGAMTSRRILEAMDAQGSGSLIPGREPKARISYLSAILSKDERFRSDKDLGGYVLKENTPPDEGQAGSDDASKLI
ncbi:hypothetical protein [Cupriavidus plantarum]|uniref:hypothetical protein n=1 Tax=Cupriavidus plantarum TaxID=942865 RepID=UPI000E21F9B9|nr:hypothetical protein [Cupriavidus plantarum]REF02463.1 hypothetical protein C7418_1273 [Cupriavidus plantarum]